jgi:hypothetical protein
MTWWKLLIAYLSLLIGMLWFLWRSRRYFR